MIVVVSTQSNNHAVLQSQQKSWGTRHWVLGTVLGAGEGCYSEERSDEESDPRQARLKGVRRLNRLFEACGGS
jgi:hypothetical protein